MRVYYGADVVAWQVANGVSAFGLSLNNAGDTVCLFEITSTDTTEVDSYSYGSTETADDRTVGRLPDGGGGWVLFDGLNPYGGSGPPAPTGCFPSPGGLSPCSATPTRKSNWGFIKSEYAD